MYMYNRILQLSVNGYIPKTLNEGRQLNKLKFHRKINTN